MLSNRQAGIASMLLIGLLGIGSGVLWFTVQASPPSYWRSLLVESKQLREERERLIHYAVDYANLYGHGGAGPGHFPCPDTDVVDEHSGPNPPCGSAPLAWGRLPDGVGRRGVRIAFSRAQPARSRYGVLRDVVNNPAQAVGGESWPSGVQLHDSLIGYVQLAQPSGQTRVIGIKQLQMPVYRWVRAWLINQWLANQLSHCTRVPTFRPSVSIKRLLHDLPVLSNGTELIRLADCKDTLLAIKSDGASGSTLPVQTRCSSSVPMCEIGSDNYVFALLGSHRAEWQGVPLQRHWIIRNGWLKKAAFWFHGNCLQSNVSCALVAPKTQNALQFLLVPERWLGSYNDV